MKVTLVYPRFNKATFGSGSIHMPLGVAFLATYLRHYGIDINVIDCTFFQSENDYLQKVRQSQPDIIGFSFSSPLADMAFHAIAATRASLPDALIVCGGSHPTVDPENTINDKNVDVVVIGEAEHLLFELCNTYSSGRRDFSHIGRIFFKDNNYTVRQTDMEAPYIQDLDSLPMLDRSFLDVDRYIALNGRLTMITSRGCPGRCTFCQPALRKLFGNKVRSHSPEYVIRDMFQIHNQYRHKNFIIEILDDTFCFNKVRVLAICDLIIKNGLNTIPWWCSNRIDLFDEDLAIQLKRAGCVGLSLGIESGSPRIRQDILKKDISEAQIGKTFRICHRHGLFTVAFFMVGSPTETLEDLEMSNSTIKKIHPDIVAVSVTTPIIGSALYYDAIRNGSFNITDSSGYGIYGVKEPMKLESLTTSDIIRYKKKLVWTWVANIWKNTLKYLSWCFPLSKAKVLFFLFKRSSATRLKWLFANSWE